MRMCIALCPAVKRVASGICDELYTIMASSQHRSDCIESGRAASTSLIFIGFNLGRLMAKRSC
jgi:hypothetical protein